MAIISEISNSCLPAKKVAVVRRSVDETSGRETKETNTTDCDSGCGCVRNTDRRCLKLVAMRCRIFGSGERTGLSMMRPQLQGVCRAGMQAELSRHTSTQIHSQLGQMYFLGNATI